MTGSAVGLVGAIGVLLIVRGLAAPSRPPVSAEGGNPGRADRLAESLARAGYAGITPGRLIGVCVAAAVLDLLAVTAVSRSLPIGVAFGVFAGWAPIALVRRRLRLRSAELREVWPDVVDNLGSAVRAGLSLPEAVGQLATRGPELLRPAFATFADDYRATGNFGACLDRLKAGLADPVADRIVESLRLAREVGGADLGRLLRTLSQFLRDDARTRAEIETRQGWTVNAARLALAAPWLALALLALRPQTVAAYNSAGGVLVLLVGGGVSFAAYRVMLRIARLPADPRVLR